MSNKDDYQAREAQRRADQERSDAANRMWQQRSEDKAAHLAEERQKTRDAMQGCGGCFPAGTRIITPTGERDIADLRKGDAVTAWSNSEGATCTRKVLKKLTHKNRQIWLVEFSDGSSIRTTSIHSFFSNGRWRKASEIKSGDTVATYTEDRCLRNKIVTGSNQTGDNQSVYNLVVEGDFTFLADGVIAHSFTYFRTFRKAMWSARELPRLICGGLVDALILAKKTLELGQ